MAKPIVHIHPSGHGVHGKRNLVVRACTNPEEQAFFAKLQEKMNAPTMSDLIRHCCVRIALKENLDIELPEQWRPLYGVD